MTETRTMSARTMHDRLAETRLINARLRAAASARLTHPRVLRDHPGDWSSRERSVFALLATLATLAAQHLRYGYDAYEADQFVNSLKGLSWADPQVYAADWFVQTSPQPHWTFDLITAAGERLGILSATYFVYWLVSLLAFGVGTAWLSERWLPRGVRSLGLLVGPLVSLAPIGILGSTGPVLWYAVPHQLGGSLAYLALAAVLTQRYRIAGLMVLLAGLAHVQHGVNVGVVTAAVGVLARGLRRSDRVWLVGGAVAAVGHAIISARVLGFFGGGDFVGQCERYIPFHCDAGSWPGFVLTDGNWILLLPQLLLVYRLVDPIRGLAVFMLPALGMALAVYADRFDVQPFGELAQSTNAYRLITLVVPFALWSLILGPLLFARLLANRVIKSERSIKERSILLALGLIAAGVIVGAILRRLFIAEAAVAVQAQPQMFAGIGTGRSTVLAVLLAVVVVVGGAGPHMKLPIRHRTWIVSGVMIVGGIVGVFASSLPINNFDFGLKESDQRVLLAAQIGDALDESAIIAHPPTEFWVRLWSRQAVVADCKTIPHRGDEVIEFERRLDAMGTFPPCLSGDSAPWIALDLSAVTALQSDFGATHALLPEWDPKLTLAQDAGWPELFSALGWSLFEIPQ